MPAKDQASKIAAAYTSIPMEDWRLHPLEEEVQNPDLDRAFEGLVEPYGAKRASDKMAVQFPDIVPTPMGGDENIEGAGSHSGATHGENATTPARRITDEGFVNLTVSSSAGIKHFHHHYHHNHYRSSPYLIVSIAMLAAVMAWHAGWEFGLRAGTPSPAWPAAAKAQPANVPSGTEMNPPTATTKLEDRRLEPLPEVTKQTRSAIRQRQPNHHEVIWFRRPSKTQPSLVRSVPQEPGSTATQDAPSDIPAQINTPTRP